MKLFPNRPLPAGAADDDKEDEDSVTEKAVLAPTTWFAGADELLVADSLEPAGDALPPNLLRLPGNSCLLDFLVVEVDGRLVVVELAAGEGVVEVEVVEARPLELNEFNLVWNLLFLLPNLFLVEALESELASVEEEAVSLGVLELAASVLEATVVCAFSFD